MVIVPISHQFWRKVDLRKTILYIFKEVGRLDGGSYPGQGTALRCTPFATRTTAAEAERIEAILFDDDLQTAIRLDLEKIENSR